RPCHGARTGLSGHPKEAARRDEARMGHHPVVRTHTLTLYVPWADERLRGQQIDESRRAQGFGRLRDLWHGRHVRAEHATRLQDIERARDYPPGLRKDENDAVGAVDRTRLPPAGQ